MLRPSPRQWSVRALACPASNISFSRGSDALPSQATRDDAIWQAPGNPGRETTGGGRLRRSARPGGASRPVTLGSRPARRALALHRPGAGRPGRRHPLGSTSSRRSARPPPASGPGRPSRRAGSDTTARPAGSDAHLLPELADRGGEGLASRRGRPGLLPAGGAPVVEFWVLRMLTQGGELGLVDRVDRCDRSCIPRPYADRPREPVVGLQGLQERRDGRVPLGDQVAGPSASRPGWAEPGDIICGSSIWSRSRIRAATRAEGSPPFLGIGPRAGILGPAAPGRGAGRRAG